MRRVYGRAPAKLAKAWGKTRQGEMPAGGNARLEVLAGRFSRESYETGDAIITQGEPGTCMYVLRSGQVEVLVGDQGGGARVLATLGEGDYFGEMALLHDAPRMATIRALGPVEALRLEAGDFRRMLDQIPALRERVEATVGARMEPALRPTA